MRRAARAIIIQNDNLLVNKRNKHGDEYFVIPGGQIEVGETSVQAAKREVWEETSIHCVVGQHIATTVSSFGHEDYFLARFISGDPAIQPNTPEFADNQVGLNTYVPMWLPLAALPNTRLLPEGVKELIIKSLHDSWPNKPIQLTS